MAVRLLILLTLLVASSFALNTKVDPLSSFCFYEPVERDVTATFQFRVTHGGKLDINAVVYDESGQSLQNWHLATTGELVLKGGALNTKFKICFDNTMARFTPKWVNFYVHHGQHPAAAKRTDLDPIEKQIADLAVRVDGLQNAQQRLRDIEKDHRATVEDANERVLLWSVFQIVTLVGMGLFQVQLLKRFLEKKTTI